MAVGLVDTNRKRLAPGMAADSVGQSRPLGGIRNHHSRHSRRHWPPLLSAQKNRRVRFECVATAAQLREPSGERFRRDRMQGHHKTAPFSFHGFSRNPDRRAKATAIEDISNLQTQGRRDPQPSVETECDKRPISQCERAIDCCHEPGDLVLVFKGSGSAVHSRRYRADFSDVPRRAPSAFRRTSAERHLPRNFRESSGDARRSLSGNCFSTGTPVSRVSFRFCGKRESRYVSHCFLPSGPAVYRLKTIDVTLSVNSSFCHSAELPRKPILPGRAAEISYNYHPLDLATGREFFGEAQIGIKMSLEGSPDDEPGPVDRIALFAGQMLRHQSAQHEFAAVVGVDAVAVIPTPRLFRRSEELVPGIEEIEKIHPRFRR